MHSNFSTPSIVPPPEWQNKLVTIGRMRENWIDDEGVMVPAGSEIIVLGLVDRVNLEYDAIALVAFSARGVAPGYFCAGIPAGLVEVRGQFRRLIDLTSAEALMHSRDAVLYSAKTYYEEFRCRR